MAKLNFKKILIGLLIALLPLGINLNPATAGGNYVINGSLNITGATTASSTLGVTGVTSLNNNATVAGTLGVTGATTTSALTASGLITSNAGLTVSATDPLSVLGNATVAGTLGVTGITTLGTANITTGNFTNFALGNSTTLGYVLTANASGVGTWQSTGSTGFLPAQTLISTTSTTLVSTGYGILFTPSKSGTVVVYISANGSNNTLADGIMVGVGSTAGSTLIALGTAMGTAFNGTATDIAAVAGNTTNLSFTAYITGLTVGTEYAIQPTFEAVTGGTASLTVTSMVVREY
ncbi:MAG: hypothetical protein ACYC97_02155 [Metallibacterium sp.]